MDKVCFRNWIIFVCACMCACQIYEFTDIFASTSKSAATKCLIGMSAAQVFSDTCNQERNG